MTQRDVVALVLVVGSVTYALAGLIHVTAGRDLPGSAMGLVAIVAVLAAILLLAL